MGKRISLSVASILIFFSMFLIVGCGEVYPTKIEVISATLKTQYFVGENIDIKGAKFVVSFSNSTTKEVYIDDKNITTNIKTLSTDIAGKKTLTVVYGEDINHKVYQNIEIMVVNPEIKEFSLIESTLPKTIKQYDEFDTSNIVAKVVYNDGEEIEIKAESLEFSEIDTSVLGEKIVTVSYEGHEVTFFIEVVKLKIKEMHPTGDISSIYYVGDVINYNIIHLGVTLDNGEEKILMGDDIQISRTIDTTQPGEYQVTILYVGDDYELEEPEMKAVFEVEVKEKP